MPAQQEGARKLDNRALFDRLLVIGGRVAEPVYVEPLRLMFGTQEFEQRRLELQTGAYSNLSDVRERLGELARAAGW